MKEEGSEKEKEVQGFLKEESQNKDKLLKVILNNFLIKFIKMFL